MSAPPDKPHDILKSYAKSLLRTQPEEWRKFEGNEEAAAVLDEFFQQPDVQELVLGQDPTGQLQATAHFPPTLESKAVYFVKKKREEITPENFQSGVMVGDISPSPVEQLITMMEEVVSPLLLSEKNMAGLPGVVVEEIVQETRQLKEEMLVMRAKIQGKPLLVLPEHLDSRLAGPMDNSMLPTIETVVTQWSHQIRDVLSKDSEQSLLEGLQLLPRTEIDFWHTRTVALQCVNDQLLSPRATEIAEVLEKANSCYWPMLQSLLRDVSAGLEEAKDVGLHLQQLRILLEKLEQANYLQLQPCLDRVLCAVYLLRAHCQYYSSPARVIMLLRKICNLLIEMTCTFVSREGVMKGLQGETQEILGRIRLSISTVEKFFQSYSTYCSDPIPTLLQEELQLWKLPPFLLFRRMDSFLQRLKTIEELYQTAMEFQKLEKAELEGVREKIFRSQLFQICEEVSELIKAFVECKYDPLDPTEEQWDKDFAAFQKKMEDVDRRLATTFRQCFEDCSRLASAVKSVHMFSSLLERPLIKAEVSPCYSALLRMFHAELKNVRVLFEAQTTSLPSPGAGQVSNKNLPPVAGQLAWALELQHQLERPYRDLFAISHPAMACAEAKEVSGQYEEMMGLLQGYSEKVYEEWMHGVGQDCHFGLEQPLILRDSVSSLLSMNFSETLVAVLQEVKYMKFLQKSSAESLFAQKESFQKFVNNVEHIVGWYNEVKRCLLPVELSLLAGELEAVESTVFCYREGIGDYIQKMRECLCDLHTRVQKAKLNVEAIAQLMEDCSATPVFGRKDQKEAALLDLSGKAETLTKRCAALKDTGVKIQKMVEENARLFKADVSSQLWLDYVGYIDGIVLDGLFKLVRKSLQLLLTNMAPAADTAPAPLFEVQMELRDGRVRYHPSLEARDDNSFLELVESLLSDLYACAACVPRLLKGELTYKRTLEEQAELSRMREKVVSLVVSAMTEAEEYSTGFEEQAQQWLEDPEDFLQRLLNFGSGASPEELEPQPEEPLARGSPCVQLFQLEIDACEATYKEVSDLANTQVFKGWLRSDCRPFKQALLAAIKSRGLVLRQHLVSHVTASLQELEGFLRDLDTGLNKPLEEGDYDGLVEMMGHVRRAKERQAATDTMFEPLKEMVALLSSYGEQMPEEIHLQLQVLPKRWDSTKKLCLHVEKTVASLQADIIPGKCGSGGTDSQQ
ncbi:dynein axonemal heavy chain 17-like [Cuculus canorus]|uniref:dynein axonemal heavy chain 17-like n=1 Tax=Cuculus canorus TaxID=55661 RepID=UPI0023AADA62|nr:dynein axonemal heavy chain 17-like [Cuculus canorus]